MDAADYLQTCAELAVAIAGFSAVALALRQQPGKQFEDNDGYRIRVIIERGLTAALFAMLPLLLGHFEIPENIIWRTGSALLGTYGLSVMARRYIGRSRENRILASRIMAKILVTVGIAMILVQVANAAGLFSSYYVGVFLLGVTWHIVSAGYVFGFTLYEWTRST